MPVPPEPRARSRRYGSRGHNWSGLVAGCLTAIVIVATIVVAARSPGQVFPGLPPDAQAFVPPPVYATWWAETERCAGRTGDVTAFAWYVVPGVTQFLSARQGWVGAYYQAPTRRIVVAEAEQFDAPVVRHEMLHALLGDVAGHPRALFRGRCADIVSCREACRADDGGSSDRPWSVRDLVELGRRAGR